MSDLIFSTYNDLHAARAIGQSLGRPTTHFVRLLRLFPAEVRHALLTESYKSSKPLFKGNFTLEQFVAFCLFAADPRFIIEDALNVATPTSVVLKRLTPEQTRIVAATIAEAEAGLIALVLSRTPSENELSSEAATLRTLAGSLGNLIEDGALAAGIAQCLLFNRRLIDSYSAETSELLRFAESLGDEEFKSYINEEDDPGADVLWYVDWQPPDVEFEKPAFDELLKETSAIFDEGRLAIVDELNSGLSNDLCLADRFGFVETPSGLFIPAHGRKTVPGHFAELVTRASENKSELLALSPRAFEEFIAGLFDAMGYTVELTKTSRDGGVDLLCLRSLHGVPFRLAVEVKRYREGRPISVQMVRSFVGANKQFEADKLVYVTTSSYTAPALAFADKYASQLLHLKDYQQIQEWCYEAKNEPWLLLPNSSTRLRKY